MTEHPITPPPGLVQHWLGNHFGTTVSGEVSDVELAIATQAARWGADWQLAEDVKWLDQHALNAPHLKITPVGESLREAMRPKPPSLKELALIALSEADQGLNESEWQQRSDTIRRALEQLDD